MPETQTVLNTTYFVTASDTPVKLGLSINGTGQTSSSVISLDDKVIADPPLTGDINLTIKNNNELDGCVMQITTIVTDTSRETNHTGLTLILTGGNSDKAYPLQEDVVKEGDSVTYSIEIRFRQLVNR